jgi:hypothetical protein
MKKTLYILSLFLLSFTTVSAQDCPIPETWTGNTGSNMTIMLTTDLITSLNVTSSDAYLVALSADGIVVGSQVVAGVTQNSLPVWGNDETSDEINGALAGEAISFQLVDGELLFDVVMPIPVSYVTNQMIAQSAAAVLTEACGGDPITYSLSAGWNMVGFTGATAQNVTEFLTDNDLLSQFVIIKDISGKLWTPEVSLLQNFVPGEGYLMFSNSDVNISFSASFNPISYNLSAGWNMVGYTGDTEQNVTEFLTDNDLLSQFVIIKDISGKLWTPEVSLLQKFVPGEGYLMFSNSPKNLSFTD